MFRCCAYRRMGLIGVLWTCTSGCSAWHASLLRDTNLRAHPRVQSIQALGDTPYDLDPSARDALLEALSDPDPDVRSAAVIAIQLPLQWVGTGYYHRDWCRSACNKLIERLSDNDRGQILVRPPCDMLGLSCPTAPIRYQAAAVLAAITQKDHEFDIEAWRRAIEEHFAKVAAGRNPYY